MPNPRVKKRAMGAGKETMTAWTRSQLDETALMMQPGHSPIDLNGGIAARR